MNLLKLGSEQETNDRRNNIHIVQRQVRPSPIMQTKGGGRMGCLSYRCRTQVAEVISSCRAEGG